MLYFSWLHLSRFGSPFSVVETKPESGQRHDSYSCLWTFSTKPGRTGQKTDRQIYSWARSSCVSDTTRLHPVRCWKSNKGYISLGVPFECSILFLSLRHRLDIYVSLHTDLFERNVVFVGQFLRYRGVLYHLAGIDVQPFFGFHFWYSHPSLFGVFVLCPSILFGKIDRIAYLYRILIAQALRRLLCERSSESPKHNWLGY